MRGVAGGVSPRPLEGGQAALVNPDIISASTTLQQAGSGGYQRLVNALQSLDQGGNISTLAATQAAQQTSINNLNSVVATMQTQIFTIQNQITTINTTLTSLQNQINAITDRLNRAGIPP